MVRPKQPRTADEIEAALKRLRDEHRQKLREVRERNRVRLRALEARHRAAFERDMRELGAAVWELLAGPRGADVSAAILPFVSEARSHLFQPVSPETREFIERFGTGKSPDLTRASRRRSGPSPSADASQAKRGQDRSERQRV